MDFSNNVITVSEGRNGAYKCRGLQLSLIGGRTTGQAEVMIQGITSKGLTARGDLSVPIEDVPGLIAELQQQLQQHAGRKAARQVSQ